jgi:hypothetical protein
MRFNRPSSVVYVKFLREPWTIITSELKFLINNSLLMHKYRVNIPLAQVLKNFGIKVDRFNSSLVPNILSDYLN